MADIEKITHIGLFPAELINDLRQIIDSARSRVAATANYELTAMYWHIGNRINSEVLGNERAEYGKQIVSQVARQLQEEYGTKGVEERTVCRMMKFAQLFPDAGEKRENNIRKHTNAYFNRKNTNSFVYLKKKLYLCSRFTKMRNNTLMPKKRKYNIIDLFAGAGGLSLGCR